MKTKEKLIIVSEFPVSPAKKQPLEHLGIVIMQCVNNRNEPFFLHYREGKLVIYDNGTPDLSNLKIERTEEGCSVHRGAPGIDTLYMFQSGEPKVLSDRHILVWSFRTKLRYILDIVTNQVVVLETANGPVNHVTDVEVLEDRYDVQFGAKHTSYNKAWEPMVYRTSSGLPITEYDSLRLQGNGRLKIIPSSTGNPVIVDPKTNKEVA